MIFFDFWHKILIDPPCTELVDIFINENPILFKKTDYE